MTPPRLLVPLFASLLLWLCSPMAPAQGTDGERAALSRLVGELRVLLPLVDEAAAQANPDARYPFLYPKLKQDLRTIDRAVSDWLDAPETPRPTAPFHGEYR